MSSGFASDPDETGYEPKLPPRWLFVPLLIACLVVVVLLGLFGGP